MANGLFKGLLRHLRRAALLPDGADLTDGQLLERYLAGRDEAAFESLLRRHGPMVLGVCRRVLRHEADAHDAFQATFLVFVRKAASIAPPARVGSWLYGVAHKTALKARALNRLRCAKERQAAGPPERPPGEARKELRALLDEALIRMPAKYRDPIVLCHLEEKSLQEAARQLGCPQGTVASRLARGRGMLARQLARRGLALGGEALTTALAQGAAPAAVPPALLASAVRAATGRAAATAAAAPHVVALADGVARSLGMAKWKAVATTLLAVTLLGGGVLLAYPALQGGQQGPERTAVPRDERPASDGEALQGSWAAMSGERNGRKLSDEDLKKWGRLVFADGKFSRRGTERAEGTYTLDQDKRPRQIDLSAGVIDWRGIYELKGTTLTLAFRFGDERATAFDSRGGLLLVFEKEN
jgi:RNA polymerase sigma factor (sigma-70 family)